MTGRNRCVRPKRAVISAERLDRYLTSQLQKLPGFDAVTVSAGYRLRTPDVDGCNWSGDVVPVHGVRAPPAEEIAARLQPIVRAARARFNISE
jgi:hypothetical protein